MIIPIAFPPHHSPSQHPTLARLGSSEIVLIELQGWLDVVEGEKAGGFIGALRIEQNDRIVLAIGNHHLEGKLVSLPKPLAVLEHRKGVEDDGSEPGTGSTRYDMVTIIKRKVTFSKRPMPVVKRT